MSYWICAIVFSTRKHTQMITLTRSHSMPNDQADHPGVLLTQAVHPTRRIMSGSIFGIVHGHSCFTVARGSHAFNGEGSMVSVTEESLFDLASITKSVVSAIILILISKGKLALESLVADYLPIQVLHGKQPTIRDLLTYAAVFQLNHWQKPYDSIPPALAREELNHATVTVGNMMRYSNYPPIALVRIAEVITDRLIEDLAKEVLFDPLGMTRATFTPRHDIHEVVATEIPVGGSEPLVGVVHDELTRNTLLPCGAAGLFGTVNDLLVFCRFLLNQGHDGASQLINRSLISQLGENRFTEGPRFGLGFGLWDEFSSGFGNVPRPLRDSDGRGAFFKNGFTGTHISVFPALDTAVVLLTNVVHERRNQSPLWINRFRHSVVTHALTGQFPHGTEMLWT